MIPPWHCDKTIITRLRVRSPGLDPLSARLRVATVLNTTNLQPGGLPSNAILCIRKLTDPLPGRLSLHRYDSHPSPAWEQAVKNAIDQITHQAARPINGPVPANAEAVIFNDRAELLACLASDWYQGQVANYWWWQSLFPGQALSTIVLSSWQESAEYIPAALGILAKKQEVISFVSALSTPYVRTMIQNIVRSFALHELNPILDVLVASAPTFSMKEGEMDVALNQEPKSSPEPSKQSVRKPPWQPWVPESNNIAIPLEQQCLLGIGLILHRAQDVVRSAKFAGAVLEWLQDSHESEHQKNIKSKGRPLKTIPPVEVRYQISEEKISDTSQSSDENFAAVANQSIEPIVLPIVDVRPGSNRLPELLPKSNPLPDNKGIYFTKKLSARELVSIELDITEKKVEPGQVPTIREQGKPINQNEATAEFTEPSVKADGLPVITIETEYGGIFYLINLGLFLELYSDFTSPLESGIALPIWDFMALLGQAMVGDKITADPVWLLLAQLAGRAKGEIPGQSFKPPNEWCLSIEWLKPFPEPGICLWSNGEGRLRVKHPEQFWLLDLILKNKSPEKLLQKQMHAYRSIADLKLQPEPMITNENVISALDRWLNWLIPYVRARLRRAIGLMEDHNLCCLLCEHHGRIQVTATHLDVVLSLTDLPIAIRLSGLDRNPGWVPAAGRYISFYFE